MTKFHTYSITENDNNYHSQKRQLELFPSLNPALPSRQKPQISSVPGVSLKDPFRYRVTIGGKAIASELTCDDAAKLASLIKRKRLTPAIEFLEERGIVSEEAQLFLLSAIGRKS